MYMYINIYESRNPQPQTPCWEQVTASVEEQHNLCASAEEGLEVHECCDGVKGSLFRTGWAEEVCVSDGMC